MLENIPSSYDTQNPVDHQGEAYQADSGSVGVGADSENGVHSGNVAETSGNNANAVSSEVSADTPDSSLEPTVIHGTTFGHGAEIISDDSLPVLIVSVPASEENESELHILVTEPPASLTEQADSKVFIFPDGTQLSLQRDYSACHLQGPVSADDETAYAAAFGEAQPLDAITFLDVDATYHLFNPALNTPWVETPDTTESQLERLWALGIQKLLPEEALVALAAHSNLHPGMASALLAGDLDGYEIGFASPLPDANTQLPDEATTKSGPNKSDPAPPIASDVPEKDQDNSETVIELSQDIALQIQGSPAPDETSVYQLLVEDCSGIEKIEDPNGFRIQTSDANVEIIYLTDGGIYVDSGIGDPQAIEELIEQDLINQGLDAQAFELEIIIAADDEAVFKIDGLDPLAPFLIAEQYGETLDQADLQSAMATDLLERLAFMLGNVDLDAIINDEPDALAQATTSDLVKLLETVFGNAIYDDSGVLSDNAITLLNNIGNQEIAWLPQPELVTAQTLGNNHGAFGVDDDGEPRIFINEDLSLAAQREAYWEEVGHFFDVALLGDAGAYGSVDSVGDEGALFRAALSGVLYNPDGSVNQAVDQEIRADVDHGQITLEDGRVLDVEFMEGNDDGTNQGDAVETLDDLELKYPGVKAEFAQVPGSEPPVYHVLVEEPDGAPLDAAQRAAIRQDLSEILAYWEATTGNNEGRVVFSSEELFSELERSEPLHTAPEFSNNDDVVRPPSEIIADLEHDMNALPPPALAPIPKKGTAAQKAAVREHNQKEMDRYEADKKALIDAYKPQVDQIMQNGSVTERQALARGLSGTPPDSFNAENFAAVTGLEEIKNTLAKNSIDNLVASGIDSTTISNNLDDFAQGLLNTDRSGVKRLFPKTMMAHLLEVDRQGRVNSTGVGLSRAPEDIKGDIQEHLGFDRNAVIDRPIHVFPTEDAFDEAANENFHGLTPSGQKKGRKWPATHNEAIPYQNAWLVHNGQMYKTDEYGRPVEIRAEPIRTPVGRQGFEGGPHGTTAIGNTPGHAQPGDVGFHLLGNDLGGTANRLNEVPANGAGGPYELNKGDYRFHFEDMTRLMTDAGYDVQATMYLEFPSPDSPDTTNPPTTRPKSLQTVSTYSKPGSMLQIPPENGTAHDRTFGANIGADWTEEQRRAYYATNLEVLAAAMAGDPSLANNSQWRQLASQQYREAKYSHFDSNEGGPVGIDKAKDREGWLISEPVMPVEGDNRLGAAMGRFGEQLGKAGNPVVEYTLAGKKYSVDFSNLPEKDFHNATFEIDPESKRLASEQYEKHAAKRLKPNHVQRSGAGGNSTRSELTETVTLPDGTKVETRYKTATYDPSTNTYEVGPPVYSATRKDGSLLSETYFKDGEPTARVTYEPVSPEEVGIEVRGEGGAPAPEGTYYRQTNYEKGPDGKFVKTERGILKSSGAKIDPPRDLNDLTDANLSKPVKTTTYDPVTRKPTATNHYNIGTAEAPGDLALNKRTEYHPDGKVAREGGFKEVARPRENSDTVDWELEWNGSVNEYDAEGSRIEQKIYNTDGEVQEHFKYDENGVKSEVTEYDASGVKSEVETFENVDGDAVRASRFDYDNVDGVAVLTTESYFEGGVEIRRAVHSAVTENDIDVTVEAGSYLQRAESAVIDGELDLSRVTITTATGSPVVTIEYLDDEVSAYTVFSSQEDADTGETLQVGTEYERTSDEDIKISEEWRDSEGNLTERKTYYADGGAQQHSKYDENGVKSEATTYDASGAKSEVETFENVDGDAVRASRFDYDNVDGVAVLTTESYFEGGVEIRRAVHSAVTEHDIDVTVEAGSYLQRAESTVIDGELDLSRVTITTVTGSPVVTIEYLDDEVSAYTEYSSQVDAVTGETYMVETEYERTPNGDNKISETWRDPQDNPISRNIYTTDDALAVTISETYSNGGWETTGVVWRNSAGTTVKRVAYDADGAETKITSESYVNNGWVKTQEEWFGPQGPTRRKNFESDGAGSKIISEEYENGGWVTKNEEFFDAEGEPTVRKTYAADGFETTITTESFVPGTWGQEGRFVLDQEEWRDANNVTLRIDDYEYSTSVRDSQLRMVTKYDPQGNILETNNYSYYYHALFSYDKKNAEGEILESASFNMSNGNWTLTKGSEVSTGKAKSDFREGGEFTKVGEWETKDGYGRTTSIKKYSEAGERLSSVETSYYMTGTSIWQQNETVGKPSLDGYALSFPTSEQNLPTTGTDSVAIKNYNNGYFKIRVFDKGNIYTDYGSSGLSEEARALVMAQYEGASSLSDQELLEYLAAELDHAPVARKMNMRPPYGTTYDIRDSEGNVNSGTIFNGNPTGTWETHDSNGVLVKKMFHDQFPRTEEYTYASDGTLSKTKRTMADDPVRYTLYDHATLEKHYYYAGWEPHLLQKTENLSQGGAVTSYVEYKGLSEGRVQEKTFNAAGEEQSYLIRNSDGTTESGTWTYNNGQRSSLTVTDANGNVVRQYAYHNGQLDEMITYEFEDNTKRVEKRYSAYGDLVFIGIPDDTGYNAITYSKATGEISGLNRTRSLSATDMQYLHKLGSELRVAGELDFFENNPQLSKIIETLDFASATGLPFDAIKNLDPSYPFDAENPDAPVPFDIDKSKTIPWLDRVDSQDWNSVYSHIPDATQRAQKIADARKSIVKMKAYLKHVPDLSGLKAMSWFMADLMAGSTSDIADLSKTFFKFSKNLANGFPNLGVKMLGKPVKELSEEGLGKLAKSIALKGGGKLLGPIATLAFLAMDMAEGIKSFKAWRDDPTKSNADLAYAVFLTMGGGPGGGVAAAISAKQKGGSPGEVTKAFFAGLLGMYDPDNPEGTFIDNIRTQRADYQGRKESRDAMRALNTSGFVGSAEWANHGDSAEFYKGNYSPGFEDAFYSWMETQDENDPNYYPRVPGVNGFYQGSTWIWDEGQMPLWRIKPGAQPPIDSLSKLEIAEFTDHPQWSRPPASSGGTGFGGCWVAREVYGDQNRAWLAFREWLYEDAPNWFRHLYLKHGQKFAAYIRKKPLLKSAIKSWMDTKIPADVDLHSEKFDKLMAQYMKIKK